MKARKGDQIRCMGITVTIDKILHQDFWDRFGWDIELIDTAGNYRHWKQYDDGGDFIPHRTRSNDCEEVYHA